MKLSDRIQSILGSVKSPSKTDLFNALEKLNIQLEELKPILKTDHEKPYYRKLLYKDEKLELLVMNWSDLECVPHDHGKSYGWIQVINGTSQNTIYEVKENILPAELFTEHQEKGKMFFAPKKGVHKMSDSGGTNLVTLHLYSPPITGMRVYNLDKCAACIVSDDCGAWWPDALHLKVKEIKLKKAAD